MASEAVGARAAGSGTPSGATLDVRSRRREQTREEIVAAAWELAERDGIAGLSLRDLAGAVGMRAPSLYTYFPSKAAIYDEMFAAGYRQLIASVDELDVDEGDPLDAVARHIEAFVDFCRASVARYQLLFTRAVPDWEPSPDAYAVSVASFEQMSEGLARLGIEDARHVDLLTALVSGLAAQQLANDPVGDRWRRLSHDAAQMFLSHARRT